MRLDHGIWELRHHSEENHSSRLNQIPETLNSLERGSAELGNSVYVEIMELNVRASLRIVFKLYRLSQQTSHYGVSQKARASVSFFHSFTNRIRLETLYRDRQPKA